jgi:hypothetical protein
MIKRKKIFRQFIQCGGGGLAGRLLKRVLLITSTAVLLGVPQIANADVVSDWNIIIVNTVTTDTLPNRQARDAAMAHAAMFDAMNAIRPYYTPAMVLITAKGYASRDAAGAQAAHDVLVALFPAKKADLDTQLATTLAQLPPDDEYGHKPVYEGILTGQAAAAAVLAVRQDDGAFVSGTFTPLPGPGEYGFTPGCSATNISAPWWGTVKPFTVPDPDYFPTDTRPGLDDSEWLAAFDEVRAYGASNSTVRTPAQTQVALYYIEGALTGVNRLARQIVAQEPVETNRAARSKQVLAHARLFAALNIGIGDSYIRTWRVKYREHFWRPYTAINFYFPGSNWTPLRQTPCHPEFYAGHGALTPTGLAAIRHYLGTDTVDVNTTSSSLPGVSLHYTAISQIIADLTNARVWSGFHYRTTMVRSNTLAFAIADWIETNMMTVLPESPLGPDDKNNDGYYLGISVQENYDLNNVENED